MFGSGTLDTVIGLVFVFLLVSMLVTIINEMIAATFMSRAKWLRRGIDRLVGAEWMEKVYAHPLVEGTSRKRSTWVIERGPSYIPSRSFANVLMNVIQEGSTEISGCRHSLRQVLDSASSTGATLDQLKNQLSDLAADMQKKGGMPAVISADAVRQLEVNAASRRVNNWATPLQGPYTVADACADIQCFIEGMPARYVRQTLESLPIGDLQRTLLTLFDDAKNDVEKLKQNIEVWFNSGMDRVNGWYKRRSQLVISIVALVLAIAMNVDAITIFKHLQAYPAAAEAIANSATQFARVNSPAAQGTALATNDQARALAEQFEAVQKKLKELAIPIGWVRHGTNAERENGQELPCDADAVGKLFVQHAFGWLLTALAATLGAPFWFDMLNRVISIRAAGKPPEEQPKPPKAVSVPVEPGQTPQEADRLQQEGLWRR
jgi:hypothetical protein